MSTCGDGASVEPRDYGGAELCASNGEAEVLEIGIVTPLVSAQENYFYFLCFMCEIV